MLQKNLTIDASVFGSGIPGQKLGHVANPWINGVEAGVLLADVLAPAGHSPHSVGSAESVDAEDI